MSNPLSSAIAALMTTRSSAQRAILNGDLGRQLVALPGSAELLLDYLVTCALPAQRQAALGLITTVLDEARMAAENRQAMGIDCLDAFAATLAQLDAANRLSEEDHYQLIQAYARAKLDPPAALALLEMQGGFAMPLRGALSTGLPNASAADMDASIEAMVRGMEGPPLAMYDQLGEMLTALPPPVRAFTISRILQRTGEPYDSFAAYWLLDPVAEVRRAAAHALLDRARSVTLVPAQATKVARLKAWLTDARERSVIEQIQAQTQLQLLGTAAAASPWRIAKLTMSLPDGAGCQSIALLLEPQKRGKLQPQVMMLMLKRGHGLKDAFVMPDVSQRAITQLLTGYGGKLPMMAVSPAALAPLLQIGLQDGLDHGILPAPGLVDVAQLLPNLDWTPQAMRLEIVIELVDKDGSLRALSPAAQQQTMQTLLPLLDNLTTFDSWFENDVALDAALQAARSRKAVDTAIFTHLEARRNWWTAQCVQTLWTLHHVQKPNLPLISCLALSALALANSKIKLATLPLMQRIAEDSAQAFISRHDDAPRAPPVPALSKTAGKRLLADILKRSERSSAWLDGFFTACAITPLVTTPEAMINIVLGKLQLGTFDEIQQIIEPIVDQLNLCFKLVRSDTKLRKYIKTLSQDSSKAWCSGFQLHVQSAKRSWSKRPKTADDKTMLKAIDTSQRSGLDETIRSALPLWIASRLGKLD